MRIFKTNPILTIVNSYLVDSPQPSTLSYLWNFGSLLGLSLVAQIVTGILLAMHYQGSALDAFQSVEHIMRDVNDGWVLRYSHANMASFFFIAVYLHISRGLYYGSYRSPRIGAWVIGTIIFFLMMARQWPIWMLINNMKLIYLYFKDNCPGLFKTEIFNPNIFNPEQKKNVWKVLKKNVWVYLIIYKIF